MFLKLSDLASGAKGTEPTAAFAEFANPSDQADTFSDTFSAILKASA